MSARRLFLAWLLPVVAVCAGVSGSQPVVNANPASSEQDNYSLKRRVSARSDTLDAWITPEAAADSLSAFWSGVDVEWLAPMDLELANFELDSVTLDSLTEVGNKKLAEMASGRLWKVSFTKLESGGFNRVQGPYAGVGLRFQQMKLYGADIRLEGGYGFSNQRPYYSAQSNLTLMTGRRQLSHGLGKGAPWRRLNVTITGGKKIRTFGGHATIPIGFVGLLRGDGPFHYFESRGGRMDIEFRPVRSVIVTTGFLYEQQRAQKMSTDWNLLNHDPDPGFNLQIPRLDTFAYTAALDWSWRSLRGTAGAQWHQISDSPLLAAYGGPGGTPGYLSFRRLQMSLESDLLDSHGNQVLIKGHWASHDRQAPLHWKSFLGGFKTLRGYPERTLVGDQAAWASLDIRCGFDLLKATHLPVLKNLGWQPILFLDWGKAWALDGPLTDSSTDSWRADAGIGFGKLIGAPGVGGNLRVYAAHQVFDGNRNEPWRFIIALEK